MTRRRLLGASVVLGAGLATGILSRRSRRASEVRPGDRDLLFAGTRVFDGRRSLDGPRDVLVRGGRIQAIEGSISTPPIAVERREGGWLFPGFVDAHVHLSFSNPAEVVTGGVTTVLDLGEPLDYAFAAHPPISFRAAGPLVTAPGGYPTRSWGANGYGLEVASDAEAREAIAMLADRGAVVVKVAIEPAGGPLLPPETLRAIVEAAHARGLKVAAHALEVAAVRSAHAAGVDVLAHTPVERLPDDLIRALARSAMSVISTVRAFGARASTRENLAALAAAGCAVAYGTDLGNGGIRPGLDVAELDLLAEALGGSEPALAAATGAAGELAGRGGVIAPGRPADLVWVPRFETFADLRRDAVVLAGAR